MRGKRAFVAGGKFGPAHALAACPDYRRERGVCWGDDGKTKVFCISLGMGFSNRGFQNLGMENLGVKIDIGETFNYSSGSLLNFQFML